MNLSRGKLNITIEIDPWYFAQTSDIHYAVSLWEKIHISKYKTFGKRGPIEPSVRWSINEVTWCVNENFEFVKMEWNHANWKVRTLFAFLLKQFTYFMLSRQSISPFLITLKKNLCVFLCFSNVFLLVYFSVDVCLCLCVRVRVCVRACLSLCLSVFPSLSLSFCVFACVLLPVCLCLSARPIALPLSYSVNLDWTLVRYSPKWHARASLNNFNIKHLTFSKHRGKQKTVTSCQMENSYL